MSIANDLNIDLILNSENHYQYRCIGSIDAQSVVTLDSLYKVPSEAHVLLDFSQIERVNSMGLSLLLKLFEDYEKRKVKVEVQHLNRMVNMLFKITGLGRFIDAVGGNSDVGSTAVGINPEPPRFIEQKSARVAETPNKSAVAREKFNFVASLQSGQQLTGWYMLNTYLQRRMQKAIHFEQASNTPDAEMTDLLFAKPFEACLMIKQFGFKPIMRPIAEADEVVILARADDLRELKDYQCANVATASKDSFVYLLGRFLCDESNLDSGKFSFDFAGNEIKALQMLIRKKSDLVFMLKKTYEGLSTFSRNNVRLLDESDTDFACHLFCVSPRINEESAVLSQILKEINHDEQGQQILKDIQIGGWSEPRQGELDMLQMVYGRYVH
jgi:anti-anti-sigma factor